MNKLFICLIFIFFGVGFVNADTNGIWNYAQDIRGGVFGSDEIGVSNYSFINPVYFKSNIYISEIIGIGSSGIVFRNNSDEVNLYISNNGSVGIGTITPQALLDVKGQILSEYDIDENDSGYTVVNKNYVDNNIGDYATEEFVYQYVNDNLVTSTSSGVTSLYKCPVISGDSYTYTSGFGRDRTSVTRNCGSSCTGLIVDSGSCYVGKYYSNSCHSVAQPCTLLGQLVPELGLIDLNIPSTVKYLGSAGSSGSVSYTFDLPNSLVGSGSINKIEGFLGISSSLNGGSGFDRRTKTLYVVASSNGKTITSNTISVNGIGEISSMVTLDFKGVGISNNELTLTFYYSGGDDDERVYYKGNNFKVKVSGSINGVSELDPN